MAQAVLPIYRRCVHERTTISYQATYVLPVGTRDFDGSVTPVHNKPDGRVVRLGGAMLDTFAVEPAPADWKLLRLPNVTVTPHIAGASLKTVAIAAAGAAEEVRRYLAGDPPLNPC